MARFTSGERRGTILLVIIIALITGGMLCFNNGITTTVFPPTVETATVIPELPDTTGSSVKAYGKKKRMKKYKTDSISGRTGSRSRKYNRQFQSGHQREYLDEKVSAGE